VSVARESGKKITFQRVRVDSGHHRRILLVTLLLAFTAFVPIGLRLFDLMVRQYDYYADLALRNQTRTTTVTAPRGTIYDTNMNILAISESTEDVYLNPRQLQQAKEDIGHISVALGEILELDPAWIASRASDTRLRYQRIASKVDAETAKRIRTLISQEEIDGIHLEPNSKRVYPYGAVAAQVIGFVNASGDGCEGIESSYNAFLAGTAGKVLTTKGNNEMDMPFSYERYLQPQTGCDVILTLDATVQQMLEKRMQEAIARYDVQNGAFGLVMDVHTGAVLAMATLGSYDPNAYLEIYDPQQAEEINQLRLSYLLHPEGSEAYEMGLQRYQQALQEARLKQWRNRCIADGYEPGSTFKVLTMAAALDSGAITLKNRFYCKGAAHISGRAQLLHCWRSAGHGSQTTAQALQNSCNLAFANIALTLGGETFYDYIKNFGVLEKTGLDLAGESKGVFFNKALITDTQKWGTASLTSASFGQTFKLTPLQLVRAISAVVNGGNLMEPYIVSEVLDADGNTVLKQEPTLVRRVISEETSRTMCELMESVVTEGTAKNAAVAGFSIGGKTGTSEKIDVLDENGRPTLDKIVSFVGVAPMDNPQYIVLVALDTPSRSTGIYISGGVMAAPTVGAVLSDILPYLGVQPSNANE
jgi:stage V sporulation protein D (sporulation-specific penicillin-binding protein)